jgi:hypothetical protein
MREFACCRRPQATLPLPLEDRPEADQVPIVVELVGRRLLLRRLAKTRPSLVDVEQRRPRLEKGVQKTAQPFDHEESNARTEPPQILHQIEIKTVQVQIDLETEKRHREGTVL